VGFSYCLSGLIVSTDSWPFVAGLVCIAVPYALRLHILLAFPSGRVRARWEVVLAWRRSGGGVCLSVEQTARFGLPANPPLLRPRRRRGRPVPHRLPAALAAGLRR
jgi:hypothetical protein